MYKTLKSAKNFKSVKRGGGKSRKISKRLQVKRGGRVTYPIEYFGGRGNVACKNANNVKKIVIVGGKRKRRRVRTRRR